MTDISDMSGKSLPSSATLLKASVVALVAAVIVLTVAVLPAEYGIDPTGIGERIGLTALNDGAQDDDEKVSLPAVAQPAASTEPVSTLNAVWKSATAYRTDEMSLTLAPDEGAEIKALMQGGERFVFSWTTAGGVVNFDMHGEALQAVNDEFTSYWKGRNEASGNGAFTAPFAGTHGWYWRNRSSAPVTVTVKTSGYYEKLYRP